MPIIHIVDDEPPLRRALGRVLTSEGFEVRSSSSGVEFLSDPDAVAVDCVLLDIAMPGMDGLSVQRELRRRGCPVPVIFLTGRGDIPMSVRAMKDGAVDFLTKPVRRAALLTAVTLAIGRARALREERLFLEDARERLARLTPREREVMRHVLAGRINKVIADRLGTAEGTVKVHRARLMEKLELASVPDLVRFAERLGIAPAEDRAPPASSAPVRPVAPG